MSLQVTELSLSGVKKVLPHVFADERGFFLQTYSKPLYAEAGIDCEFVQDNHSFSRKGTVRGMHFQRHPGQAKLISVASGKIFDVVVDIRRDSPTFGHWEGVYLDGEKHEQLFVPVGFAHGFVVVSDVAHVCYKVSSVYNPLEEKGFRFDDPDVRIAWPELDFIISDRDKAAPFLWELLL